MESRQEEPRAAPRRRRWLRAGVAWWLALFAIWMLLVDSLARPEVIAGMGAAFLALPVALLVSARVERRFQMRARWLREVRSAPFFVLRDSLLVLRALCLHVIGREEMRGEFRLVPWSPAEGDDVAANSWQAFAVIATSIAPNTYIIGVDPERGVALAHQLTPTTPASLRASVVGATPAEPNAEPNAPVEGGAGA